MGNRRPLSRLGTGKAAQKIYFLLCSTVSRIVKFQIWLRFSRYYPIDWFLDNNRRVFARYNAIQRIMNIHEKSMDMVTVISRERNRHDYTDNALGLLNVYTFVFFFNGNTPQRTSDRRKIAGDICKFFVRKKKTGRATGHASLYPIARDLIRSLRAIGPIISGLGLRSLLL